jgi:hypothetical protein
MQESIKKRTMRRVVAVFYLRKVLNRFVLKVGILTLGALSFGSLVHVAAVFENMPSISNIGSFSLFSYYAFMNTDIFVQSVIVMAGLVTLWIMRDVLKLIHIPNVKLSHA